MKKFLNNKVAVATVLIILLLLSTCLLSVTLHRNYQATHKEINRVYVPLDPTSDAPPIHFDGTLFYHKSKLSRGVTLDGTWTADGKTLTSTKADAFISAHTQQNTDRGPLHHFTFLYWPAVYGDFFDGDFFHMNHVQDYVRFTFNASWEIFVMEIYDSLSDTTEYIPYIWDEIHDYFHFSSSFDME